MPAVDGVSRADLAVSPVHGLIVVSAGVPHDGTTSDGHGFSSGPTGAVLLAAVIFGRHGKAFTGGFRRRLRHKLSRTSACLAPRG